MFGATSEPSPAAGSSGSSKKRRSKKKKGKGAAPAASSERDAEADAEADVLASAIDMYTAPESQAEALTQSQAHQSESYRAKDLVSGVLDPQFA